MSLIKHRDAAISYFIRCTVLTPTPRPLLHQDASPAGRRVRLAFSTFRARIMPLELGERAATVAVLRPMRSIDHTAQHRRAGHLPAQAGEELQTYPVAYREDEEDLTALDTVMPRCPITTAASSVAVTFPTLKPATFLGPIQNPIARARKIASSGYERSVLTSQSITGCSP
jgi:hypothetical protein